MSATIPVVLDVLMPTKDRPALLERALRYYRQIGMDQTIRIVDGSDHSGAKANAETCRKFSDALKIEHLACGPQMSIWDRISIGLERTEAPYVAMTGDDDFLVPDGLRSAAERLGAEPSASAVVGVDLRRDLSGDPVSYGFPYGYERSARAEPRLEQRLAAQAEQPMVLFYALRRANVAREAYRRIAAAGFEDDSDPFFGLFGELIDAALQLVAGPVLWVEQLVGVREYGRPTQASRFRRDALARTRDPQWQRKVELFEAVLASAIREAAEAPPDPEGVSRTYVDRYLTRFLMLQLARHLAGPAPVHAYQRYVQMVWPPTLLRYLLWKARGLPRATRHVQAGLRAEDVQWLRRIHAFAELPAAEGADSLSMGATGSTKSRP